MRQPSRSTAHRVLHELRSGIRHLVEHQAQPRHRGSANRSLRKATTHPAARVLLIDTTRLDVFALDTVTLRWIQAELAVVWRRRAQSHSRGFLRLEITTIFTPGLTTERSTRHGPHRQISRNRYDTCCGRSRFTNSSKRAGTASGRRLRSAAVDSFNPTTRSSSAIRSARSPTATVRPPSTTVSVSQPLRPAWPAWQSGARWHCSVRPADRCDRWTHSGSTPPARCISPVRLGPTSSARGTSSLGGQANYST